MCVSVPESTVASSRHLGVPQPKNDSVHSFLCTSFIDSSGAIHVVLYSVQSPTAFSDAREKFQLLTQLTDETDTALKRSLDLVANRQVQATLVGTQFAEHEKKLAEAVGINKKLKDQFDHIDEQDLLPDQLQTIAMLQKQIESLEDQVIDRDAALQEIESQMKQDYEQHDQLIRKLNSEVHTCVYGCNVFCS